jgi:hypothetical protein
LRRRSWTFQESQVERREHQDDSGVHHQPLPESIPEEQDVHADHDRYQRENEKHDAWLPPHTSFYYEQRAPSGMQLVISVLYHSPA